MEAYNILIQFELTLNKENMSILCANMRLFIYTPKTNEIVAIIEAYSHNECEAVARQEYGSTKYGWTYAQVSGNCGKRKIRRKLSLGYPLKIESLRSPQAKAA
jgi:hypothetical protein